jgi:hypothetical protein
LQEVANLTTLNRTAEQQHASKVASLSLQLQAASSKVIKLESRLADARHAAADRARCVQQHAYSNDDNEDDYQQSLQEEAARTVVNHSSGQQQEQQDGYGSGWTAEQNDEGSNGYHCKQTASCAVGSPGQVSTDNAECCIEAYPCEACEESNEQIAALTKQLQEAQATMAALQAELSAARQQAGLECCSAAWANQQVKDLSSQLQDAREKVVVAEGVAEVAKQQAVKAARELQDLQDAHAAVQESLQKAAAAAAASRTEAMAVAEAAAATAAAEEEQSRVGVERSVKARAWLRQQVAQQRRSEAQLKEQLREASAKVRIKSLTSR